MGYDSDDQLDELIEKLDSNPRKNNYDKEDEYEPKRKSKNTPKRKSTSAKQQGKKREQPKSKRARSSSAAEAQPTETDKQIELMRLKLEYIKEERLLKQLTKS